MGKAENAAWQLLREKKRGAESKMIHEGPAFSAVAMEVGKLGNLADHTETWPKTLDWFSRFLAVLIADQQPRRARGRAFRRVQRKHRRQQSVIDQPCPFRAARRHDSPANLNFTIMSSMKLFSG